ncbi:3'(2'),5'-bisphosphate nucleotidase CysQ [Parvibaculum sp. MBR-TMA-1.3b-4.2]
MTASSPAPATDRGTLARELRRIALIAGAAIMRHYATDFEVKQKDDNSPVTAADQEAEDIILRELAKVTPDIPVVSEEKAAAGYIPEFSNRFFLVDPLDGTKEFVNKNGEFTVNIALIEDRVPVAGVVYAPAKNRLFLGYGPGQAYEQELAPDAEGLIEGAAEPRRIAVRRPSEEGMVVVASRTHRDQKTDEYLSLYKVKEFLAAGSSLKFCLVAAGEADIYPRHGRTMEWDTAAGHAVLAAAGGSVTQLDGTPLLYGKTERGLDNPFFVAKGSLA